VNIIENLIKEIKCCEKNTVFYDNDMNKQYIICPDYNILMAVTTQCNLFFTSIASIDT